MYKCFGLKIIKGRYVELYTVLLSGNCPFLKFIFHIFVTDPCQRYQRMSLDSGWFACKCLPLSVLDQGSPLLLVVLSSQVILP